MSVVKLNERVAPRDALLTALIDMLPPAGTEWPHAERRNWIKMLERAFAVVYRGEPVKPNPVVAKPAKPRKAKAEYPFYIDRSNYARRAGGAQIMPHDVPSDHAIYDLRGEGDLGAIVWADGSQGVTGLTVDISAVGAK